MLLDVTINFATHVVAQRTQVAGIYFYHPPVNIIFSSVGVLARARQDKKISIFLYYLYREMIFLPPNVLYVCDINARARLPFSCEVEATA